MCSVGLILCIKFAFAVFFFSLFSRAVVAQWITPRTLNRKVLGSNLLAAAVVPFGKALYHHCLVPREGLRAAGPLAYKQCFLS